jgi:hypothetical protein
MRAEDVTPGYAKNLIDNYFKMFTRHYLEKNTSLSQEEIDGYLCDDVCIPSTAYLEILWERYFKKGNQELTRWTNIFIQEMIDYKEALDTITVQDLKEVTLI